MRLKVKIGDAPREVAVWSLIGVDDENRWNEFAPGMDCAKDFLHQDQSMTRTDS